jgi:hypothetical protein
MTSGYFYFYFHHHGPIKTNKYTGIPKCPTGIASYRRPLERYWDWESVWLLYGLRNGWLVFREFFFFIKIGFG